jgi:hypothetical protein
MNVPSSFCSSTKSFGSALSESLMLPEVLTRPSDYAARGRIGFFPAYQRGQRQDSPWRETRNSAEAEAIAM